MSIPSSSQFVPASPTTESTCRKEYANTTAQDVNNNIHPIVQNKPPTMNNNNNERGLPTIITQPAAQPNNNRINAANANIVNNNNHQHYQPQTNISGGAAKNPVKSAFRLVQQSWGRIVTVNACDAKDRPIQFRFRFLEVIGNGTFGIVCKAHDLDTDSIVAIKTVFQDQHHQYNEEFLSLVLEHMPLSLDKIDPTTKADAQLRPLLRHFFQALAYLHSLGICHRDIKPHNLLIDPLRQTAKLCDFGCSKRLVPGEPNIQYICARYYRAPEIALSWPHYTLAIDLWSAGCVMGELYAGKPLFPGKNSIDQLARIVKVLGSPSEEELAAMGQDRRRIRASGTGSVDRRSALRAAVGGEAPEVAIDLLMGLLQYDPSKRLTAVQVLKHPYFEHY